MKNRPIRRVFLASPYSGDRARNSLYLHRAMRDSIGRGEAPFAPHLLYTGMLDDSVLMERELGIRLGTRWLTIADALVVYIDYGISEGMKAEIQLAEHCLSPVEYRNIGKNK